MKQREEDIKNVSNVLEFFNRTAKALDVFAEQSEHNSYMLICVEDVTVNGEGEELTHIVMGGDRNELISAIYQSMKEDKDSRRIFIKAAGMYAARKVFEKQKEGGEK